MQKIQIKLLALFFLVLFGLYGFQPIASVFAEESNELKPFKDLKISDMGIHIYFDYSNVTWTTDGSGVDLGSSQSLIRLKPNPSSLQVLNNVKFGVTDSETLEKERYPQGVIQSTKLKAVTTNQTAQDTFQFEDETIVEYSFDVETAIGTNTVVNHTLMEVWADTVDSNLGNDYAVINETLFKQSRNFGPENGYFNGRDNRISGADYKTVIVGYRNFKEGALSDLKGFISTVTGADTEDIRIQDYYFSDAVITFNTSTRLKTWVKEVVNWALKKNNIGNFALSRLKLGSTNGLFDGFIKDVNGAINGITTTVGSAIDHFIDDPVDATLGSVLRGAKDVSDTIGSSVGPWVMGALGSVGDAGGSIGQIVGKTGGGVIDEPFGQFAGLLGDIAGNLLPVLVILLVVGLVVFLAYWTLKGVIANQAAKRL